MACCACWHSSVRAGGAIITVLRNGSTNFPASVVFSTSDGTATSPADYTSVSNTVVFGVGEISASVIIFGDTRE